MAFLPGWKTEITVDSIDLTVIGQTLGWSVDTTALPKSVFGTKYRNTIEGQTVVTLSISGHLDDAKVPDLIAIEAASDPVTYEIQIGTVGVDDGGTITGNGVVSNLTLDSDSEGQWSWSMELESDGAFTYTPAPAP